MKNGWDAGILMVSKSHVTKTYLTRLYNDYYTKKVDAMDQKIENQFL